MTTSVRPNPRLAEIPDELLKPGRDRHPTSRFHAARRLAYWLERHNIRPTFGELEDERARRGIR